MKKLFTEAEQKRFDQQAALRILSKYDPAEGFFGVQQYEWDESLHPRHEAGSSEGGQFAPAEGGSAASAASKVPHPEIKTLPAQAEIHHRIKQEVHRAADAFGYPRDKIIFSENDSYVHVGDTIYMAAASADLSTGEIRVQLNSTKPSDVYEAMTHEIMHIQFEDVNTFYFAKLGEYSAVGMTPEKWKEVRAADSYVDSWEKAFKDNNAEQELEFEDGVSAYSAEHWDAYHKGEQRSKYLPTTETMAEIARLDVKGARLEEVVGPRWLKAYRTVRELHRKVPTDRKWMGSQ